MRDSVCTALKIKFSGNCRVTSCDFSPIKAPNRKIMSFSSSSGVGSMLQERSFSSCKVLCRHFRIGKATYLRIFHDKLGLKKFRLRRVPHALSINQKSERVSYSKFLLRALMEQKASGFQRIITGDEHGSSSIISVIRSGRRRMIGFLNVSSRKSIWKRAWFRSFG
jgi:hypothetical protein